jgi:hypothetical protein
MLANTLVKRVDQKWQKLAHFQLTTCFVIVQSVEELRDKHFEVQQNVNVQHSHKIGATHYDRLFVFLADLFLIYRDLFFY